MDKTISKKQMKKFSHIISILLFLGISHISGISQEIIIDTDRGIEPRETKADLNGDVIITAKIIEEGYFLKGAIIKVTEDLDTTVKVIDDTLHKVSIYDLLITQNNRYIVSAIERIVGDTCYGEFNRYSFFIFDENLNLLNFKRYLSPVTCTRSPIVLTQRDDGRIYGMSLTPDFLFLLEINEQGDTLQTFFSDADSIKGGRLKLLKSNKEGVAFYAFLNRFYENTDKWTVLTVDTSLNFIFTPVIYSNSVNEVPRAMRFKWLNDSIYVITSDIGFSNDKYYKGDIFVFEANANQNHQDLEPYVHFYRPDTTDQISFNGPTFTNKDFIYVGSWRASNPGASFNGRYMVGVVDENMNMKAMKSLGKDGYQYDMIAMQATDDGGCIVTGTVHDNANAPEYDFDLFIRKLMPDDLVNVAENTSDPYDSDYEIFPNPGKNKINIFSINKNIIVEILSPGGKALLKKQFIENEVNRIDMQGFPTGVYLIRITDDKGHSEISKWVKL